MRRTGVANLPLHGGKAPPWLFRKMVKLSRAITDVLLYEYGHDEFLRRMADPFWFQAFGCTLGFDWHSSGLSTTTCGALKMAIDPEEHGIAVAGGKGKTSRKAPGEIEEISNLFSLSTKKTESLLHASKTSAKVDNSCVQDGYSLYHHTFLFTEKGKWAVVQQGMNENNMYARRYHWLSDGVRSFVDEPHSAICGERKEERALNLISKDNRETRKGSVDLVKDDPIHLVKYIAHPQKLITEFTCGKQNVLSLPPHHPLLDVDISRGGMKVLRNAYELQPKNYEELVSLRGLGPKRLRALALLSCLLFGTRIDWKDPNIFSFSHGGKDGYPRPIDKRTYSNSIRTLEEAIGQAKLGRNEKYSAIKRLREFL